MSRRVAVLLWVVLGVAVWNAIFDLYISRAAREYLQRQAEYELHRGPDPSIPAFMNHAKQTGAIAASLWAIVITGSGVVTIFWRKKEDADI